MSVVDELEIELTANAKKANTSIDNLVSKLDTLSGSLSKIDGSKLSGLANGVSKLGMATKTLSGVKATDYNRIAKGFERFAKINTSKFSGLSSGLNLLAKGMNAIGSVQNLGNITPSINAIKNLAKVNMSGFDTEKLKSIASTLSSFATDLSGVGKIEGSVTRLVSAMARLSSSGQYIENVATHFPELGDKVVELVGKLSRVGAIDANLAKLVDGIARLASAGKKAADSTKYMKSFGDAVHNLLTRLKHAPQINANIANTIQGLGNLASSGSRISTVSNSATTGSNKLGNALKNLKGRIQGAHKSSKGFASSIGMFYAKFFLVIRAVKKFGEALGSAQDYIEEFNYFSVALDKIGKDSAKQFKKAGYNSAEEYAKSFRSRFSKLQTQLTGYKVDYDTGDATSQMTHNLGLDLTEVMKFNAAIAQITNSAGMLGETSIMTSKALTMLSADWSSLSNQDLSDVMNNMQSALIGQSRAVYKYGIDITSAGLAQTALSHGIRVSIKDLDQQSKMQLRALTMLEQSKVAYGDLARTINQPANQLRMLRAGFHNLARTIGSLFMPIVQKLYPYLNAMVMVLQEFAQWIAKLAGIKLGDIGGSVKAPEMPDYSDAVDDSGKVADNMDKTAKKAKKASDNLQGFDVINKLQENDRDTDTGAGNGKPNNTSLDLSKELEKALGNYEKIWDEAFKSNQNKAVQLANKIKKAILDGWRKGDFTEIGKSLAQWINKGLNKVPWSKIKATTKKIAKSIATFLNGFVEDLDWTKLGENFSEGLNTWFETSYTFFKTFDWLKFGKSIKEGITSAINTFNAKLAGKSLGTKLRGMIQFAFGVMVDFPYKNLGKKIGDYINGFLEDMGRVDNRTGLTGWQELGKTISDGITGILDTIDTALSTVNWWEVGKSIGDFLGQIDWIGIFARLGKVIANALFSVLKTGISAFVNDPLGVAGTLATVLASVFAYKKLKTLWASLKTVFSNGISNALISAKINSKGLTDKFSGLGSKMGRAMGVALVAAYGWWENSITAGGDAKGNVKRYASGSDDKSILLKEVVQMMDKFGYGSNTLTVDRLIGRLNKKLESGEISEKTIRKALDKNYKTMTDKQSVQSAADFLDLLGESKGNVATKIDKGKKELNDYKPIITQTTKYSKAVDELNKKMKKLGISSSESKSIQEKLKKALENGTITWEDYKKITDKNYNSTDALKKKIDSLKPKSVKVEAKTDGKGDVDSLQKSVNNTKGKTVTVKAKTYGINSIGDLSVAMSTLKNKYISVNINPKLRKDWFKLVQKQLQERTFTINAKTTTKGKITADALKSAGIKSEEGKKIDFKKLASLLGKVDASWDSNKVLRVPKSAKELIKYLNLKAIKYGTYAKGGFPEDGWFRASKGEYFGQFDDGTSYIANNRQIENGIASQIAPAVHAAVKAGIREVLSEMPIGGTGDVYLDGVKVTREVMSTANKISKSTGATWRMA